MRRQGQYAEPGISQMVAAQMQHAQRMQQNAGMGHFSGRGDSLRPDEEREYMSSKAEGQWQWDRDMPKGSDVYKEGQGSDISRSLFQGQRSDSKLGMERQAKAHQDGMEVGYEDGTLPQTFEGLEQKFIQDIMKLAKEHEDAEDAENARHRERLSEINAQYQEKLMTIRARQAPQREEVLRRESQARHQQYQQTNMNSHQNNVGPSDTHGYGAATTTSGAFGDMHPAYAAGHFDSYGERTSFAGDGHGMGTRGQYPGGRAYNSGGRYF